jgi:DNA-binding Lrp family transcriptional regulator
MDAIDRQIIELLRRNARAPLKVVAGAVGLARSSVAERISRLEAAGVIIGYRAEIAPEHAGGAGAMVLLEMTSTPQPETVGRIVADPAVVRCYSLAGEIDLLIEISAAHGAGLNEVRDRLSALPGAARARTHFILKREKG